MIVWGGASRGRLFGDGAAYDPGINRWRLIARGPLGARTGHSVLWTGDEMLVWGGCCERRGAELGTGAAYDPVADTWRRLPPAPIEARRDHTAVWTGRHMLVWGGAVFEHAFADGAMYSPRRDRWSPLPDAPVEPRYSHSAVWTGSEMIVWGGATLEPVTLNDGAAFGAGWSHVSRSGPGRSAHSAVWTGTEMLVWGGCCGKAGRELGGGSAYEPTSNTWGALPESGLAPRVEHVALPANGRMLIWGGTNSEGRLGDGAVFDPLGDAWAPLPPGPLQPRSGAAAVWTGEMLLVWGGCCGAGERPLPDGAALVVATGEPLPTAEPPGNETAEPGLDPKDLDLGIGALIVLAGLILLAAVVALARGLRKRLAR
jgi:N-acetylneuraminic acid mutarotase